MILAFTPTAWEQLTWWLENDRRVHRRILRLLEATVRDPFAGEGKPELLSENLAGHWSRRITQEHRLVYRVVAPPKDSGGTAATLLVVACRYHY
ncbi:MAG: Txe/YoeB family addiction module toxin [Sporichthyaceae bacterium]